MATLDDVRRYALALPETVESTHFGMPSFRVADKGFAGVSKDGTRVMLQLDDGEAEQAVAAHPDLMRELRRGTTLLGIDADLAGLPASRLAALIKAAWRHRAPKRLQRDV